MTVRSTSANSEKPLGVCRQCHKTCLVSNNNNTQHHQNIYNNQRQIDHHEHEIEQHQLQRQNNVCQINTNEQQEIKNTTTEVDVNANPREFTEDNWGPLSFLTSVLSPYDPFSPVPVPHISVLPPSPPTTIKSSSNNNFWEDADLSNATDSATPIVSILICRKL